MIENLYYYLLLLLSIIYYYLYLITSIFTINLVELKMDRDATSQPLLKRIRLESEPTKKLEYDRSKILGRGGFATVYSGKLDGKQVAVKRLQQDLAVNNGNQGKREEEALRELDHPNVISLLHVEEDEDFK